MRARLVGAGESGHGGIGGALAGQAAAALALRFVTHAPIHLGVFAVRLRLHVADDSQQQVIGLRVGRLAPGDERGVAHLRFGQLLPHVKDGLEGARGLREGVVAIGYPGREFAD